MGDLAEVAIATSPDASGTLESTTQTQQQAASPTIPGNAVVQETTTSQPVQKESGLIESAITSGFAAGRYDQDPEYNVSQAATNIGTKQFQTSAKDITSNQQTRNESIATSTMDVEGNITNIENKIVGFVQSAGEKARGLTDKVGGLFKKISDTRASLSTGFEKLKAGAVEKVTKFGGSAAEKVGEGLGTAYAKGEELYIKGKEVVNTTQEWVQNTYTEVKAVVRTKKEEFIEDIRSVGRGIKSGFETMAKMKKTHFLRESAKLQIARDLSFKASSFLYNLAEQADSSKQNQEQEDTRTQNQSEVRKVLTEELGDLNVGRTVSRLIKGASVDLWRKGLKRREAVRLLSSEVFGN